MTKEQLLKDNTRLELENREMIKKEEEIKKAIN